MFSTTKLRPKTLLILNTEINVAVCMLKKNEYEQDYFPARRPQFRAEGGQRLSRQLRVQRGPTLDRTPTQGHSHPYSDGNSGDTPFASPHMWAVGGPTWTGRRCAPCAACGPGGNRLFPSIDSYAVFVGTLFAAREGSTSDLTLGPRLIFGRERSHDNRSVHF